ncbi:MAG TPA: 2-oxoacid:acceptor oxidoreductase subunit alpha [Bacillota bacterium]|nr:2-oxoacid:acceptor oxidoreductase subunit alpha [Bacillota bacterium]
MRTELVWKVGGEQGSGIEKPGSIFLDACSRLGYYTFGYRHFMSRIMGGHTNYQVRISHRPVHAIGDLTDVLLIDSKGAQEAIDMNVHEMAPDGVIIADAGMKAEMPAGSRVKLLKVPFHGIAGEIGSDLYWNMVAMGASCAVTALDRQALRDMVYAVFARKGEKVVQANYTAIDRGYAYVMEHYGEHPHLQIAPVPDPKRRLTMEGDNASAFGALAAGCRFLAAYPITPASMIMEWMAKECHKVGGVVVQAEDEISAVLMAIGANYAGARGMTATSGPGFSLMQEALGLSGLTETPVVIVDVQRGGPGTGLPTKPEQGDINEMIYGSHGEIPRVVIAPGTYDECFYDTAEAFNLADRHQCPVIVAMDLTLGMGKGTVERLDWSRLHADRGKIMTAEELQTMGGVYQRFANTEDGISPRAFPGTPGGVHLNTADEHTFAGRITEDQADRKAIHDKRLRKTDHVDFPGLAVRGDLPADLVLVGFGSVTGPMWEAADRMAAKGQRVAVCQMRRLWPFPVAELQGVLGQVRAALVCEHNATGQLAHLIRAQCGGDLLPGLRKYDGDPFRPAEVVARAEEVVADVRNARIA